MRKLWVVAVALAVCAALLPASAGAKQVETSVELEIYGEIEASGSVTYYFIGFVNPDQILGPGGFSDGFSSRGDQEVANAFRCAVKRKVQLFRDEPEAPDTLVGQARSTLGIFSGEIGLPATQVPGNYFAQVADRRLRGSPHKPRLKCLVGTSPTIAVQPPALGQ